ncbi:hypothetical protein [Sphaerotilus sp.]|uniref:hypothetical protein n=1 Tax=Sphaerotilus sp. TaxID=2093942 RepID=UPI002ACED4C6|nr:hypothetical protein [Sphaerotilus sp.]MDZ7855918.1 hypothetical protein [Sphaerotilus sp.]
MLSTEHRQRTDQPMFRVAQAGDIEYLVKECEVLTGHAGRTFVIAGAERLTYRLQWHALGCKVQRLGDDDKALSTQFLLLPEFHDHSLCEALRAGQLYTHPVTR